MKFFISRKLLISIILFFIYFIIILFKGKFNKRFVKKSILSLQKSISTSSIKSFHFHSINVTTLLDSNIRNNTVLIFEPEFFHHECTPGYTKYFLDLGYNVDIILDNFGSNSFYFFKLLENIRIFTFYNLSELTDHSKDFQLIFKNYSFIVIETTKPTRYKTFKDLGFFKMNNTIFILHSIELIFTKGISSFCNQNRIWTLGHFKNTLYVNPHYYGDIKIKNKNNRTKFFIISTIQRNYKDLILASEKLKNENLEFEVIVIGRGKSFSKEALSENIKENFIFKYHVIYKELYEAVNSSDYIIINLYPNYKNNELFRRNRLTGSSQLSFGFYKLPLIHKSFAEFYNMTSENSFLFDNSNFYEIMRKAILLNAQEYKEKQKNLIKLSDSLYKLSLSNIKKTLHSILLQKN